MLLFVPLGPFICDSNERLYIVVDGGMGVSVTETEITTEQTWLVFEGTPYKTVTIRLTKNGRWNDRVTEGLNAEKLSKKQQAPYKWECLSEMLLATDGRRRKEVKSGWRLHRKVILHGGGGWGR